MIRGAGGGGKGGGGSARAPVESPDSLRSKQFARVIDLVSEGEIAGLVNGLQSIYLNGTPLQNADGTFNFTDVTMVTRTGTQSQTYIPGFPSSEAEVAVGTEIKAAVPVVRTISNSNTSAARVTISIPRLSFQDLTNGDTTGTSVEIAIDRQSAGGGFVEVLRDAITGKTTSQYQRAYRIELTGAAPWDIRVRRITADSTQSNLQNATWWSSYTEIIDAKLRYPNSALVALAIDAQQFNAIPTRGYEMKGLLVRIPSNYNPVTRVYTGTWNGTFSIAWTNNPAWCFYDLLTNERYGLGAFLSGDQVDKWALYTIGQYCDELVPDGFGGTEPRFTCSLYLQTREEAYTVIGNMASIFRAMTYWAGGTIVAVQDAPSNPVALFTPANVIGGAFSYEGSSAKVRHTVALVAWNDPADRYRQKIEYVEDADGIARYGVIQTEITAFGCTSRGQAHRLGRWLLFSERMETDVVSFRTGLEGAVVQPGDIIQTTDPVRAGVRMGGRIVSATAAALTLDAPVTIASGKTYTAWAVLPNGTVESRAVTTTPQTTSAITVSPAFTTTPQAMSMWVLAASDLVPETWRVISVQEVDATQAQITALSYRADKYAAVEQGLVLEPLQTSALTAIQQPPTNIAVSESLYLVTSTIVGTRITVSWTSSAQSYELRWRKKVSGNWATLSTSATSIDIQPVIAGKYEFSLVAFNAIGARSQPVVFTQEIFGLTTKPANVTGYTITAFAGAAFANWTPSTDLDVRVGGKVQIRHTELTAGADFARAIVMEEFNGDASNGRVDLIAGTYYAVFIDSTGNMSATPAAFVATEALLTGFTTVATTVQHPAFAGVKTGLIATGGEMKLNGDELFDSTELFDSSQFFDGNNVLFGEYQFDTVLDLGTVAARRYHVGIRSWSFDTDDSFDSTEKFDSLDLFDGDFPIDTDVTVLAQVSDDGTTYTSWTPFMVADFRGRYAKFKAQITSGLPSQNRKITELAIAVKTAA